MNLGSAVTSFVGRAPSVEALEDLLASQRLVTLCGPAGVGKTRLACEVARRVPELGDAGGVWLCSLSDARSPEAFLCEVARTLDVPLGSRGLAGQLETALRARGPTLLVLDNFEQLGDDAADIVARWHARLPELWQLVTSRRPLHAPGEAVFEVGPLDAEAGAALFVERARSRRRDFVPDEGLISEIVQRVDGLPLAIELAAAHVGVGLEAIRDTLATAPSTLASRRVGVSPRHRSLEEALAWSWDLLAPREQRALAELSVFAGDFDLEAARAVMSVDALEELLDASLIAASGGRYRVLGVVRDFAARKLEDRTAEARHTAHFVARARAGGCLDEAELLAALERKPAADDAVALARAFDAVVSMRGPLSRRVAVLDAVLAEVRSGELLLLRASAYLDEGRVEESRRDRDEALALAASLGDDRLGGLALDALARQAWHEGRIADARALFERALAVHRDGRTLTSLANALVLLGEQAAARAAYEEALALHRAAGDRRGVVLALGNLADLQHEMGLLELAASACAEAVELARAIGDHANEAAFLTNLGNLSLERGHLDQGRAELELALAGHEAVGNRRWAAIARSFLGRHDELAGHADAAEQRYAHALADHEAVGNPLFEGLVACWLARVLARRGAAADACHLLGRAEVRLAGGPWEDVATVVRSEIAPDEAATRRVAELQAQAPAVLPAELRSALASLTRVAATAPAVVRLATSGRWFELPDHPRVALHTRRALHLVLGALTIARRDNPGAALEAGEVLAAGWPGERVHPTAGAARVYNAVATLRGMGLRWLLLRRDDGYLLDPAAPIELAPE
jgi:predicted ATPase/Tfp pilus assembly protein PilF